MGNIYTGSNSGKAGLNVKKTDNTVDVFGVSQIQLDSNLTLTDNGNGSVTINSTGGGGGGGVTELSFGSTGLTPAVATTGSITVAGTLEVGSGGTGLNSLGSADQFLKVNGAGTALEYATVNTGIDGSGAANQVAVFSDADTIGGSSDLTFTDSAGVQTLLVSGSEPRIQTQDTTSTVGNRATITLDPSVPDGTGGVAMFWGTDADLELYMKLGAFAGANNIETKGRDFRFFGATGNLMTMDESALNTGVGGIFGLNNGSDPLPLPTRTLDVGKESSSTNTVLNILGLTRQSSGTPAVGIGVGMDFVVETSASNDEIGATIEAITTNVGSTTEAFDFTFNLMAGGATAAEKMRIASTGAITFNQAYTFPTADGNANDVLTTDGAGNLSFAAAGGGGTPAGSNTEIQFNNGGAFGANSALTFNTATTPPTLTAGSALGGTTTVFAQSAGVTTGGNLISNTTGYVFSLQAVSLAGVEFGVGQTTERYQVETGKTTTQSFGQTQNTINGAGTYDCYPSQGGLIVVEGAAAVITLNLVLAQETITGVYDSTAKPFLTGGVPPSGTVDKNGYGTWQIGDQVTVMAGLNLGQTPNITIRSYNSTTNGLDGEATLAPADDPTTATQINGVPSDSVGGGQQTITTNYTAKTFVLRADGTNALGVSWVCIG